MFKLIARLFDRTPRLVVTPVWWETEHLRDIVVFTPLKGVADQLKPLSCKTTREGGMYSVSIELASPSLVGDIKRTFKGATIVTNALSWNNSRN